MFDMKYMNLIVEGCFSQENCSLKILQVSTMSDVYCVHIVYIGYDIANSGWGYQCYCIFY